MGVRGELFSTKVSLQNRTYFFNVKENRLGDLYLNIVESKNRDEGGFERQSVILFADDLQSFLQGFDEALRVLEKGQREKRRGKKVEAQGSPGVSRQARPSPLGRGPRGDVRTRSDGYARSDERPWGSERPRSDGPKRPGPGDRPKKPGLRSSGSRPGPRPGAKSGPKSGPRNEKKRDGAPPRKKRVVVRKS